MRKYKIKHCSFRTVREVCEEFNARKFNARSCCGNVIGSCNETVWCPTEGHPMWGNEICNGGDLIKEHSAKSGKERLRHVEQILEKYSDETRITFIKRKGSSKYQFIGVYKLDCTTTQNSLKTNAPTCYWVRQPDLYDVE